MTKLGDQLQKLLLVLMLVTILGEGLYLVVYSYTNDCNNPNMECFEDDK